MHLRDPVSVLKNLGQLDMRQSYLTGVLLMTVVVCGCSAQTEVIPGSGPVQQFVRSEHWLYVYGSRSATREDLINMEVFNGFEPGFSVDSAIKLFGEPWRVMPRRGGAEYVEYMTPQGRFRLGSEESGIDPREIDIGFPLYLFPNDRRPDMLFPPYVVAQLRPTAEKEVVLLFECGYEQPIIHVLMEAGQVEKVVWLHESELGRRRDPDQCKD